MISFTSSIPLSSGHSPGGISSAPSSASASGGATVDGTVRARTTRSSTTSYPRASRRARTAGARTAAASAPGAGVGESRLELVEERLGGLGVAVERELVNPSEPAGCGGHDGGTDATVRLGDEPDGGVRSQQLHCLLDGERTAGPSVLPELHDARQVARLERAHHGHRPIQPYSDPRLVFSPKDR